MAGKKAVQHRVKAVMIVAKLAGAQGGESYFRRGRVLPSTVAEAEITRLLELGLIEAEEVVLDGDTSGEGGSGGSAPTKPAGNAGYDKQAAWAQHLGIEIPAEVASAKDKDAVKALIEAHEQAQASSGN